MLRLGLLGEEATIIHHVSDLEDDANTRPEELAEAAVLHGGCPSVLGHPVLDVSGGAKKYVLVDIVIVVVVIIVVVVVVVVTIVVVIVK